MRYLLDTSIIAELVSAEPAAKVAEWIDSLPAETVFLSVVTIGEIRKGIEALPEGHRKQAAVRWLYDELLARFDGKLLPIGVEVMVEWGVIRATAPDLGAVDALVAATAKHYACTLVTQDGDRFTPVGIAVANPWA